ncbi:glycosyltransferase [Aliarcobacter skirrowii]|uniref:glycosyltransferase n=1 Tax=Aliarcobacter skirrowii TaxID=28200 RepID=UPI00082E9278|nr:glycosyltransferase [Aliarcobacter skirrowii]
MDSKKMNIAIFVNSEQKFGGSFQYELRVCQILKEVRYKYNFNFFTLNEKNIDHFRKNNIEVKLLSKKDLEITLINKHKIDLVYFLYPANFNFINLHYIITIWDLCHRDFNEFPEVRNNYEFENRELFYSSIGLKKAIAIISDSKQGKKNIIKRYNIDKNRVHVLKFLPREHKEFTFININKKYNINRPYIYYPAQFWAHKNHIYILKALKILKENFNIEIFALFSGTDYGNLSYILEQAKFMGIDKQIKYLGFVDDNEIPNLYKQSLALVMPTYFGPTNIPPLEAFEYETPVCYSDLKGLRKQVKDAAFLIDLKNPNSLVNALLCILNNHNKVQKKIKTGKKILRKWTPNDFKNSLEKIFDNFNNIRKCWSNTETPKTKTFSDIPKDFVSIISNIIKFQNSDNKYVVYGNGTIGKTIQALIPDKIVGYVDIADENNHPKNLKDMKYDKIIISVLGREEEIIKYLVEDLQINIDKIITLEL